MKDDISVKLRLFNALLNDCEGAEIFERIYRADVEYTGVLCELTEGYISNGVSDALFYYAENDREGLFDILYGTTDGILEEIPRLAECFSLLGEADISKAFSFFDDRFDALCQRSDFKDIIIRAYSSISPCNVNRQLARIYDIIRLYESDDGLLSYLKEFENTAYDHLH